MKLEIIFLKLAVIFIGIPVLALCIFVVPQVANFAAELYPDFSFIKYLVLADLYATAIPFYLALYQVFKILGNINRNEAFSEASVRGIKNIKLCAMAYSIIYTVGMPLFYLMAERDDAPGIILIGLAIIFAGMVVAVFASVLQKLFENAIARKS